MYYEGCTSATDVFHCQERSFRATFYQYKYVRACVRACVCVCAKGQVLAVAIESPDQSAWLEYHVQPVQAVH